jgi:hypothetical protein
MADKASKSRPAHRGQLTKLTNRAEEILSIDGPIPRAKKDLLSSTIDQISEKLDYLAKLDNEISDSLLDDVEKYQAAIIEADDYAVLAKDDLKKFKNFLADLQSSSSLDTSISSASSEPRIRKVNLPKLSLTPFSGDILKWQSFKDGFDAAVHNDTSLGDIQKFQYLRAHLSGDAAQAIDGLSLTNDNYANAIDLLVERYGQKHKIINAYMTALWKLESPTGSLVSLIKFYDAVESYIRGLAAIGKSEDSYGDLLVPIILERLPPSTRRQISRANDGSDAWSLKNLRKAMRKEIDVLQAGDLTQDIVHETPATAAAFFTKTNRGKPHAFHRPIRPPRCAFCKHEHKASLCNNVTSKTARRDIVERDKLCINCLSNSHGVDDCRSKYRCADCNGKHHTSLCLGNSNEKRGGKNQVHACFTSEKSQHPVLLKTAVTNIYSGHHSTCATVLFDEGAQRSFITEATADKLNIRQKETENINVTAFGGKSEGLRSLKVANIALRDQYNGQDIGIRALIVPEITTPMQNLVRLDIATLPHLEGLTLAHPPSDVNSLDISVLIGADYYWSIVGDHTIRGNGPIAVSSKLGYLLSGPNTTQTTASVLSTNVMHISEDKQLQKFWDIESIGIYDESHPKDFSYDKYIASHLRTEDNRYIAKLPWKQDHAPLPTNFHVTEKRTRSMVRRLSPDIRDTYDRIIKEQINRDFIELVHNDDERCGHYLPHRAVKKDSETTPIRIVYDCSCQTGTNPSLNDCLETGPPLLNDLASIMLRFRLNNIAISADIEKAFLHVGIEESDRKFTKFLWLSDSNDPESQFEIYQFRVVLFGAVCSPFILNATVKSHLEQNDCDTVLIILNRC